MSEPFTERLSRFTPDGSGLDRDALLFAAGRASVRPGRPWRALAGLLAASQLLTLVFLWPHTPAAPSVVHMPLVAVEPPSPSLPPADPRSWTMNLRTLNELDDLPPPAVSDSLVPDDPPLRASSPLATFLN
jgi:hypothetical protein